MDKLFLFEKERLDEVSAEATLRGHKFDGRHCHLSGKGIDDMTPEEKREASRKGVGGSSIADLFGEGFGKENGPIIEYRKKRGEEIPVTEAQQRRFDQGHFSEPMIFGMVEKILPEGWKVVLDKNRYTDNEREYMYADFDGILVSPDGEEFPLEIKSYNDFPGGEKPASGVYGEGGKLPHDHYKWQVRYYMHELNARAGVAAILKVGDYDDSALKLVVFYRDFDKENEMLETIDDFWLNHVKTGKIPPYATLTEDGFAAIKALKIFPSEYVQDKKIEYEQNSDEIKKMVKEYEQIENEIDEEEKALKEKNKKRESRLRAIETYLRQEMADAQYAHIEIDGKNYTAKREFVEETRGVDTGKLKKYYPDFYQEVFELANKVTKKADEKFTLVIEKK